MGTRPRKAWQAHEIGSCLVHARQRCQMQKHTHQTLLGARLRQRGEGGVKFRLQAMGRSHNMMRITTEWQGSISKIMLCAAHAAASLLLTGATCIAFKKTRSSVVQELVKSTGSSSYPPDEATAVGPVVRPGGWEMRLPSAFTDRPQACCSKGESSCSPCAGRAQCDMVPVSYMGAWLVGTADVRGLPVVPIHGAPRERLRLLQPARNGKSHLVV